MREFAFRPIGIVHSPIKRQSDAPIQPRYSELEGEIEIFDEFSSGLKHLDGFSHITVTFVFDRSEGCELVTMPYMGEEKRGVFATRSPYRPNPIGISVLNLLGVDGNRVRVRRLDMLDETPVLDIKPYVPGFVDEDKVRRGWLEGRPENTDGSKSPRDKREER